MCVAKVGKGGHAAAALRDLRCYLLRREALSHVHQRRVERRRAGQILAVTQAALVVVDPFPGAGGGFVLGQGEHTSRLICVYVDQAAGAIDGRTTPFRSAKKAGKDYCFFIQPNGHKLAATAKCGKLFRCLFVGLRRARGQQVLRQHLPCERGRNGRHWLGTRSKFPRHIARRVRPFLNGKERLTAGTIKQVEITLLGGLCDRIDTVAVAFYREQGGRRGKITIPDVVMHSLKVPKALAGFCVEGQQRVGK